MNYLLHINIPRNIDNLLMRKFVNLHIYCQNREKLNSMSSEKFLESKIKIGEKFNKFMVMVQKY